MKKKNIIKFHMIFSLILFTLSFIALIIFGTRDEFLKEANIIAGLSLLMFIYFMVVVVIYAIQRNKKYLQSLEEKGLYQKPKIDKKASIKIKSILFFVAIFALLIGTILGFGLGNDTVKLISAIAFIFILLGLFIEPVIRDYKRDKKITDSSEENDENEEAITAFGVPDVINSKKCLFVATLMTGKRYYCSKFKNSYYFIQFKETIDINNLAINDELLNDKKNFRMNYEDITFFSFGVSPKTKFVFNKNKNI